MTKLPSFDVSRRGLFLGAGVGAVAALSGCHRLGGGGGDGTLVVALDPEPLALASAGSIDAGASVVSPKLFDRLFNTDPHGHPVPMLAQGAETRDGGKTVVIRLRPGVRWHDGQPLTSSDVAFSIENVWKLHNPRSALAFSDLQGIDTPAPDQLTLRFAQPAPYIFSALADGMAQVVPRHIYAGSNVTTNPANQRPVGSGPWIFEQWERGNFIALRRNPHYWDAGKPRLNRLVFRIISAGASTVSALESGAVDYAGNGLPLVDFDRLGHNPDLWVRSLGSEAAPSFNGFAFNINRPHLGDPRVRQAFAHAIDKQFILTNIYRGHGVLADSPIAPGSEWHAAGLPVYSLDLAKAEALLDAAGLPRGKDGVRLRLFNDIMPPSPFHPRVAQYIRQSLSRIGVELQLRQEGLPAYLKRIFTTRDWDTETYSTGSDPDPAIGIQRFYWSGSVSPGVPYSNPTHYATPKVDALLEAAKVEPDQARRKALYDSVQQQVQSDLPLIPLLFPNNIEAGSRRFDIPYSARVRNLADARAV